MTDLPHYDLDPVEQDVFDLMRRQPGDVFSLDDLSGQLGTAAPEVKTALRRLLDLGFVERASGDAEAFILSPAAPEL
jgi:predicted transcriptional regulator